MKNKAGKDTVSFLGKDMEIEGSLKFTGTIRIEGHFKGNIFSKGTLVIGEGGKVEADIHASHIVNYGEIHGKVIADKSIDIRVPGKVFGDIEAPVVEIEKGVVFEGGCQMHQVNALIKSGETIN